MDDDKKNKQRMLIMGILVAVGLLAAVLSGVRFLAPPREQVMGSLDGPGGGGMRDAEAGTSKPAPAPATGGEPTTDRGTTPQGNAAPPPVGVEGGRGD